MVTRNIISQSIRMAAAAVVAVPLTACAAHRIEGPMPPAPPAANQERVLLSENFSTYDPHWRQVRGHWAVVGGKLLQARDDAKELNTVLFYDPLTVADAEITAETSMIADLPEFQTGDDQDLIASKRRIAGAGVVFRYQDENNFYLFRTAGEEGVVLGKVVQGEWHELANPRAADFAGARLRNDTPYTLRVRMVGNRIQCWIANKAVANLEDGTFGTGRIGLATFRSKATFSALRVVEK